MLSLLDVVDAVSDLLPELSDVLELEVVSELDLLSEVDLLESLLPFLELPSSVYLFSPGDLARP